jgi:hypothetical protein
MAFLFADSFDHYATADITKKWSSHGGAGGSINSSAGRRSTSGYRYVGSSGTSGTLRKTLPVSGAGFVTGVWMMTNEPPYAPGSHDPVIAIVQDGTIHLYLRFNSDFTFSVVRGDGTVLGTSSVSGMSVGVGGYVEWKGIIDNSAGSYVVRCNNAVILNESSKDTQNGGTAGWNAYWFGHNIFADRSSYQNVATIDNDDLYVLDQSGSAFNDFLGDIRVDVRAVTGAGATTQFTPSAGSNYQNVDDAAANGDTDYNSTDVVGEIDTFTAEDAPVVGGGILAVQVVLQAKKEDAGVCTVAPVIRHSGVNYPAAAQFPSTSYTFLCTPYEQNPGTSAAWVEADFDAAEFGYTKVT